MTTFFEVISPIRRQLLIGLVLGIISSFMGYGAGGAIILSIVIGTLLIMIKETGMQTIKTFVYCLSLCLSFYVVGFNKISDPVSINSIFMFGSFILLPTIVCFFHFRIMSPK